MFYERSVNFILLTFFVLALIVPGGCSNESTELGPGAELPATDTSSRDAGVIAVTAILKDAYSTPLAGRRFMLQADGGSRTRALTDARGTLSLRLTPGTDYILRAVNDADGKPADSANTRLLKLTVNAAGKVDVTDSRRLFAADLQSHSSGQAGSETSSAKFQSSRFGESVFAP